MQHTCKICNNYDCSIIRALSTHIHRKHIGFNSRKYYDKYIKKENEGICVCGKITSFRSIVKGYRDKCNSCAQAGRNNSFYDKHHSIRAKEKISTFTIERHFNDPSSFKHTRGKSGWYFSRKNNGKIFYRSSYELRAFEILEQLDEVKFYCSCKFSIDYVKPDNTIHRYIPDIEVIYKSGRRQIIEIKAEWQLENGITIAKANAAKEKFGEDYIIWTESELKNVASA